MMFPERKRQFRSTSSLRAVWFENNYFTEMCSGSKAGSYVRLIDFVYYSALVLRGIKRIKRRRQFRSPSSLHGVRGVWFGVEHLFINNLPLRHSAWLNILKRTWWVRQEQLREEEAVSQPLLPARFVFKKEPFMSTLKNYWY